jgi:predicted HicB family RNase H-like nuclease
MARPEISPERRRSRRLNVQYSAAEHAAVEAAARAAGLAVSTWVREVSIREARNSGVPASIVEQLGSHGSAQERD